MEAQIPPHGNGTSQMVVQEVHALVSGSNETSSILDMVLFGPVAEIAIRFLDKIHMLRGFNPERESIYEKTHVSVIQTTMSAYL